MAKYLEINIEDFLEWAKEQPSAYYEFYDDHLSDHFKECETEFGDMDAVDFFHFCKTDIESGQDVMEEYIVDLIEELEDEDYFGTEGFNGRFR